MKSSSDSSNQLSQENHNHFKRSSSWVESVLVELGTLEILAGTRDLTKVEDLVSSSLDYSEASLFKVRNDHMLSERRLRVLLPQAWDHSHSFETGGGGGCTPSSHIPLQNFLIADHRISDSIEIQKSLLSIFPSRMQITGGDTLTKTAAALSNEFCVPKPMITKVVESPF